MSARPFAVSALVALACRSNAMASEGEATARPGPYCPAPAQPSCPAQQGVAAGCLLQRDQAMGDQTVDLREDPGEGPDASAAAPPGPRSAGEAGSKARAFWQPVVAEEKAAEANEQNAADEAVQQPVVAEEKAEEATEQKAADEAVQQPLVAEEEEAEEATEQKAADEAVQQPVVVEEKAAEATDQKAADEAVQQPVVAEEEEAEEDTEQKAADEAVQQPVVVEEKAANATEQKAADEAVQQPVVAEEKAEEATEQKAANSSTDAAAAGTLEQLQSAAAAGTLDVAAAHVLERCAEELRAAVGKHVWGLRGGRETKAWHIELTAVLFVTACAVLAVFCAAASARGSEVHRRGLETASGAATRRLGPGPGFPLPSAPAVLPVPRRASEAPSAMPPPAVRAQKPPPSWAGGEAPAAAAEEPALCPDLVVPEGSECTLLAPRFQRAPAARGHVVQITDLRGASVFRAVLGGADPATCITLESACEDRVFALARSAGPGLEVCQSGGQPFGQLRASPAKPGVYALTRRGAGPLRIEVERSPQQTVLRALEEASGELLAIGEEPGESGGRSVRIGPMVDAGLMTLALLGVDWLELRAK